jgi:methionine synthase II (cobalamin-independent)
VFDTDSDAMVLKNMPITSIGSLPFTDVDRAVDVVIETCPEVPFWPQLPLRSFRERMYVQCLENVPSIIIDEEGETMYVDTNVTTGIEKFYDDVACDNTDAFGISEEAAPGLYRLLERLTTVKDRIVSIKAQLAGPFTIGIGLKDEKGKPIIYNDAYFDIVKKALHMKAKWAIKTIRNSFPDRNVILFYDEPAMVSFGSAFVSVSAEDVTNLFNEVVDGLDATVGVHCCGNTDWPVLLRSRVDVINYDAYNYLETLFYFKSELATFLSRGGEIAPGIVPSTAEEISAVNEESLIARWKRYRELSVTVDEAGTRQEPLVTTACGLGSLAEGDALKALDLLRRLSDLVKERLPDSVRD